MIDETISALEAKIKELKVDAKYYWEQYEFRTKERNELSDENAKLKEDNARLKVALEKIDKNDERFSQISHKSIAREALKEGDK